MNLFITAALFCALGLVLNRAYLRMALRRQLLDQPNHRSSHEVPTPKGAGVVIGAVVCGFAGTWIIVQGPTMLAWALLGGAPLVVVGLLDDIHDLRKSVRIAVHLACAAWAVACLGNPTVGLPLPVPDWLGYVLQLVALVWLMNLYNFMDGIDGIAGVQAIIFLLGIFMLALPGQDASIHMAVLAAATVAFLVFNLPPARLFMGDAGSIFFGFSIGVISLHNAEEGSFTMGASLVLLAAFLVDATFTLLYRLATGQQWWQAHRSHLYQRMAQRHGHRRTLAAFVVYATLWLAPLAALANTSRWQWAALTLACLPVLCACIGYGAGRPEPLPDTSPHAARSSSPGNA